jgi:hypothetical protein
VPGQGTSSMVGLVATLALICNQGGVGARIGRIGAA